MAITRTTPKPRCGCALHEYSHAPIFYFRRRSVTPCRLRCAAVLLSAASVLAVSTVQAETWRLVPSLGILETLTNNVNLAPSGSARSDLVTQLTPALSISELGARTRLSGSVSMPIVLYARTGSENNQVYAQASLNGTVEAIDKFFFIDGTILVSQQYFSPFGPQPVGLANATQNRYTAESYSVSPYIKGRTLGDVQYLIRDDNLWTKRQRSAGLGRQRRLHQSFPGERIEAICTDRLGARLRPKLGDIRITAAVADATSPGCVFCIMLIRSCSSRPASAMRTTITGSRRIAARSTVSEQHGTRPTAPMWKPTGNIAFSGRPICSISPTARR